MTVVGQLDFRIESADDFKDLSRGDLDRESLARFQGGRDVNAR